MREAVTFVGAVLAVSLMAACGSVPDLRFGDDADAGLGLSADATIPTTTPPPASSSGGGSDSAPPPSGVDSSVANPGEDASSIDSALPPILDANVPPEAAPPDVCPNHPPFGTSCCGTIECRPNGFTPCDCTTCTAKCTATQVCCIDKTSKFQQCADTLADCPKP